MMMRMHFWMAQGSNNAMKPYRSFENENIMRSQHHQIRNSRERRANQTVNNNTNMRRAEEVPRNQPQNAVEGAGASNTGISVFKVIREYPLIRFEVILFFIIFVCTIRFFILGNRSEVIIYCTAIFIIFIMLLLYYGCTSKRNVPNEPDSNPADPEFDEIINMNVDSCNNRSPNQGSIYVNRSFNQGNVVVIPTVVMLPPTDDDQIDVDSTEDCNISLPPYEVAVQLPDSDNEIEQSSQQPPPSYSDAVENEDISDL